jgi:hypothetical protein
MMMTTGSRCSFQILFSVRVISPERYRVTSRKHRRHRHCIEGNCACPNRREEQELEEVISRRSDDIRADMVYRALLGVSPTCAMLTEAAGADKVREFIREVLNVDMATFN